MGYGDLLLASGKAKKLHEKTGDPISIGDGKTVFWFDLYKGVPYLSKKPARWYYSYPGHRGYYVPVTHEWVLDYRAEPADIAFFPGELEQFDFGDYVVIEPNIKWGSCIGKLWGYDRYQKVVDDNPDIQFIQPIHKEARFRLQGVKHVETTLRSVAALIHNAVSCVLPDGFLHHVAAAVNTPAVVIFGGFAPPQCLSYPIHRTLSWGEPKGFKMSKEEGNAAMQKISVQEVCRHLREVVEDMHRV